MSRVIWMNSLIDGEVKGDESDKPYMLQFAGRLDRLCDGNRKFSDFIDYTESRAVISGDYQGCKDGWELIKHKGNWYEPEEGLAESGRTSYHVQCRQHAVTGDHVCRTIPGRGQ